MSEAPDAGDEQPSSEDINVSIGAGVPRKPRKSKPELTEPEAGPGPTPESAQR